MKDILKVVVFGCLSLVLFVPLYVTPELFFPFITGKNFAFRILVEIAFAGWIVSALMDTRYRPKFSWIAVAIATLVGVMLIANIFGVYAPKSIWGNFERMEGWITLVHFFIYFLVLGSMLHNQKQWWWFLNASLVAGVIMSLYAFGQMSGAIEISQGGQWRVDGRLGNSTYLAVYMLFQMFIAAWLGINSRSRNMQLVYSALFLLFGLVLFNTGTRGTTLGLIIGSLCSFGYLTLMAPKGATIKKIALGALIAVILIVGGFIAARNSDFVQNNEMLKRVAGITLAEGSIRFAVWGMALEGVKERPILGWGQENFSYVFNKYYDPYLYRAEPWYDRTHNIFLDWLIAGGILGLIAYLAVAFAALWYAVVIPVRERFFSKTQSDSPFSTVEQALLLGLFAAYMFHNLVVFDNLASLIFYATVLALVHAQVSLSIASIEAVSVQQKMITQFYMPLIVLSLATVVYVGTIPNIKAAGDIIDALQAPTPTQQLQVFERAFSRNSFADQEITEQYIQQAMYIARSSDVSREDKEVFIRAAEEAMLRLMAQKPEDARLHDFLSNFYKVTGALEKAQEQAAIARSLSPRKQSIIINQGILEILQEDLPAARDFFKTAFELDTTNAEAAVYYAAIEARLGDTATAKEILGTEFVSAFAKSDFALAFTKEGGNQAFLLELLQVRLEEDPSNIQNYINLSSLQYELGYTVDAVATLEEAAQLFPTTSERMRCFIQNIKSGAAVEEGCS